MHNVICTTCISSNVLRMFRQSATHACLHWLIALRFIISRGLLHAAANVTALQGSSSMSPHDQAGPSNSAAGTAPRVQETAETFLTLFGKKENCEAAQRAIEQQMEVSS